MNNKIKDMITAIASGDVVESNALFMSVISEKVTVKIIEKQREVSSMLFVDESTNKPVVGKVYGDWKVTKFEPLKIDDSGLSYIGGIAALTNQNTKEDVLIQHDHALRAAEWWVSYKNRQITGKTLKETLDKIIKLK